MAGKVLLDTNIVIALFSRDKAVSLQVSSSKILLPSIVLGELYYGARKSGQMASNLARISEFAGSVAVLNCDAVTAQHFGQIKDRLRSKGRPIPDNDVWIAAVAQQYGLPLATRDGHFKEVDGLALEIW